MIKDIPKYEVKDVAMAVVQEENEEGALQWNVYLLNLKPDLIYGVLVASKGYGTLNGETVKTSTLRHFIEDLPGESYAKIEPIMDKLFGLSNEFWLSFYHNNNLFDKKYVFLPESITEANYTMIPLIHKRGVMIR